MGFTSQVPALSTFLCVCGLLLSEALLYVQGLMSARGFAFLVGVIICWLFLDNLVTAQDLQCATKTAITTECERSLLRRVAFASQQNNVLRKRLENEIALHLETAMALDRAEEDLQSRRGGFGLKRSISECDFARGY